MPDTPLDQTRTNVSLRPDCSRCAGLCCIALALDKGDSFPFDKPAGEPCRHLQTDFRCDIHHRLVEEGCRGCVRFDCLGAGQRVIQEVFSGRDWRSDPELLPGIMDAFRVMRRVHDQLQLLELTKSLALSADEVVRRDRLIAGLSPDDGWDEAGLTDFARSDVPAQVSAFLASLKTHVTQADGPPNIQKPREET